MVNWEFWGGAAAIAAPQANLPIAGGLLAVKGTKAVLRRRKAAADEKKRVLAEGASRAAAVGAGDKITPIRVEWSQLNCAYVNTKTGHRCQLLDNLQGAAQPGRLLAIMGPSGSGKTTTLNALAGQVPLSKGISLSGRVTFNGGDGAALAPLVAYVQQEDVFYSQLTARETLEMAAAMRLPKSMSPTARGEVVDQLLLKLGLASVAGTIVGDAKTRGLSGGERKRLSIGCELIRRPSVIFLDEPTTGLDSFQAQKVMQVLRDLAKEGCTVVASIHQPRSSIFQLFDDLLVLAGGREVYAGPADQALVKFAASGHKCPEHHNPADFIADITGIDQTCPDEGQERVAKLVADAGERQAALPPITHEACEAQAALAVAESRKVARTAPLGAQFKALLRRAWRQVTRDKGRIVLKLATGCQSAVVFGCIWWRLGRAQSGIQSRLGMLQVVATYTNQGSLFGTLNLFPKEKLIVNRERAKGAYGAAPYLLSKIVSDIPLYVLYPAAFGAVVYPLTGLKAGLKPFAAFVGSNVLGAATAASLGMAVGAVVPNVEAALVAGPAIMLVFIVFGGLYTNDADVPRALRWIAQVSCIKRTFEGLCCNELAGLAFDDEGQGSLPTGDAALRRLGYGGSSTLGAARGQARILAFNYWLTYHLLRANKPRFQALEAPGGHGV